MLLLTFSRKNISYLFLHCFLKNARKSCAPFIGSLFPHEKFLHGKILPLNPPLNSPPNQKFPLKTSVHFPVTITIYKRKSKFITCSPSHGGCGEVGRPRRHSNQVFRLRRIKLLSHNFDPVTLGKK